MGEENGNFGLQSTPWSNGVQQRDTIHDGKGAKCVRTAKEENIFAIIVSVKVWELVARHDYWRNIRCWEALFGWRFFAMGWGQC